MPLLGIELTESAKVEAWKLVPAAENAVVKRVDQHRPALRKKNRWGKRAHLQRRCLSNQMYPALECLQASVKGWHRHDE